SFRALFLTAIKAGHVFFIFDMGNIDYPDRGAVEDMLWCNRMIKGKGGALVLVNPRGRFWDNIQAEGVTNLIAYRWDLQEALDDFERALFSDNVADTLLRGNLRAYRPSLLVRVARVADLRDGKEHKPDELPEDLRRISSIEVVQLHEPPPPGSVVA